MKENKLPYNEKNPFKVPGNYFGNFEDRLMDKVTVAQESELLVGKQNAGFKVPDNYFEGLEDRIMQKVETKPKQSKVISLLNRESFYYAAGTAAVFVALITTLFTSPTQPIGFADLDLVTIEGYLHETLEFSSPEVSRYLHEDEFSFAPSSRLDVDHQAVIEYLSETVEEPSMIYNED